MSYIAVGGFEILEVLVGKVGENKNGFNRLEQENWKSLRSDELYRCGGI